MPRRSGIQFYLPTHSQISRHLLKPSRFSGVYSSAQPGKILHATGTWREYQDPNLVCAGIGYFVPRDETGATGADQLAIAYARAGINASIDLIGQYSGCILDVDARRVVLIQDSLGIGSMFYCKTPEGIAFSSELRGLLDLVNNSDLDLEFVANYLTLGSTLTSRTPYSKISRLIGGQTLIYQDSSIVLHTPWRPVDSDYSHKCSGTDYRDNFLQLIASAFDPVANRNQPMWCDVSGGLDSTTVYFMAKKLDLSIEPFSVLSQSIHDYGDTETLHKIFSSNDMSWHCFDVIEALPFSELPTRRGDEPGGEIGYATRNKLYNLRKTNDVDVMLSGMGGDQLFGSVDEMPFYLSDYLYTGHIKKLFTHANSWRMHEQEGRAAIFWLNYYAFRPMMRRILKRSLVADTVSDVSWISASFNRTYRLAKKRRRLFNTGIVSPGLDRLWQNMFTVCAAECASKSHVFYPNYYYPLLYRPLVEFMLRVPPELRRPAYADRVLQREAMIGIMPDVVRKRSGKGSGQGSFEYSFKTAGGWHERLRESRLVELGVFNKDAWSNALKRAEFGLFEKLPVFCASICLELWLQG